MSFVQVPYISQHISSLDSVSFLDEEAWGLRQDENGSEEDESRGDHLHGEGDAPLAGGGAGDIGVHDVVRPVTEEGGELIVDLIETD